jgi:aspartate racemase
VICTNTMHRMAEAVQAATPLPLLHIADATAAAVKAQGLHTVGLLGTRFTMEGDFYRGRLQRQHELQVLVPEQAGMDAVHRIIYDELIQGIIREESRRAYQDVIADLAARGAQGVILGCTEIPLLVKQADVTIPVFDTTAIHAQAAVDWAFLNDGLSTDFIS